MAAVRIGGVDGVTLPIVAVRNILQFLAHNGVSPLLYVVMLVLSYKLDFCCFHRLALHYDLAVWCFCWLRDYGILDDFLTPLRVVILSIGIVIISVTLTSKYYGKRCGGNDGCA